MDVTGQELSQGFWEIYCSWDEPIEGEMERTPPVWERVDSE